MANSSPTCEVCIFAFDSEDHRPLMLPCGHAFCCSCLETLQDNGTNSCPSCRASCDIDVEDLVVCYTLIPKGASQANKDKDNICSHHNFPFLYWCTTCKRVACKQCALAAHNGHTLSLKEEAVKESEKSSDSRDTLISKLTTKMAMLQSYMRACDDHLSDLTEMIARTETQRDHLATQKRQIEEDLSALQRKSKYNTMTTEERNWTQMMITSRTREAPDLQDNLIVVKNIIQHKVLEIIQNVDKNGMKFLSTTFNHMQDNKEWIIKNEDHAQHALLTMWTTDNRPSSVIVSNTPRDAIPSLDILLKSLSQVCDRVDLHLLGSFWQTYYGHDQENDDLIAVFLSSSTRYKLRTFYGRVSRETVNKLSAGKLFCLGLRIDRALDISIVNAFTNRHCHSLHISVCEQVGRVGLEPIDSRLLSKCCVFLHFVELSDGDLPWLMYVVDALVPDHHGAQSSHHGQVNRMAGLYLVDCRFTTLEAARLLTWIHNSRLTTTVWYKTTSHDDFSKKLLEERASAERIQLIWDAVLPRAPRPPR